MSHVGQMIRVELDRHPKAYTVKWFAEQLHCKRTNVYDIFNRCSVDTALLARISRILTMIFSLTFQKILKRRSDMAMQRHIEKQKFLYVRYT